MKFVRAHPMGVVLLTSLLTLGTMAGVLIFYPHWVDNRLIDQLDNREFSVRGQAIIQAAARAEVRAPMRRKLVAALDTESDRQFFAIVTSLNAANIPIVNPLHIDRAKALEFATAPDPYAQVWLLWQIINKRHDNRYVRQALKSASTNEHIDVRTGAALLAALLKDDAVLAKLLADEEGAVRAAAALDAGLAGRRTLGDAIVEQLADADAEVVGNAAAGLAYLDPTEYSPKLCKLLAETQDAGSRERLCGVMMILNNDLAREAVSKLLASGRQKRQPSPMTLLAAGKLGLDGAADDIRTVLAEVAKGRPTKRCIVHAAIIAAGELNVPVRRELYTICHKYWKPNWRSELMLASAAHLLGRQAADDTGQASDAPTRRACERLLLDRARYAYLRPTTGPAAPVQKTPIASAAAAAAFWLLNPSVEPTIQLERVASGYGTVEFTGRSVTSASEVMNAASYSILAGDDVAWRVGRSGRPEAFQLGLRMILRKYVYDENIRGAGAMMLAWAARTDDQKRIAIQRITERLEPGETYSGEDDPVLAGRYRCALLILGVKKYVDAVGDQRNDSGHAVAAAFTALCFAGDIETLDYLLCNAYIPARKVAGYMIYDGLDRVLAVCTPELPTVQAAASGRIQLWQAHIVQDYYVLHRDAFFPGSKE